MVIRKEKGFTLVEIVVVLIVIGILTTLAVPPFIRSIERAKNREAIAMVNYLRSAEKAEQLQRGNFTPCASLAACNNSLSLTMTSVDWACQVSQAGTVFTASCSRAAGWPDARTWSANCSNNTDPTCTGGTYCN